MKRSLFTLIILMLTIVLSAQEVRSTPGDDYRTGKHYMEKKDYQNALLYFTKAAELGHAAAQYELGVMYDYGFGVIKDIGKALNWFRKSAAREYAPAQNNLGYCYHYGEGTPKDRVRAMEWYLKAGDQGYAKAQYNLGVLYQDNEDFTHAAEWYERAAAQGHMKAQANLGTLYFYGKGVTKDMTKAREFYSKAAAQGDEMAKNCLAQVPVQEEVKPEPAPVKKTGRVVSKKGAALEAVQSLSQNNDVDMDIPRCGTVNNKLFAVIIGNEKYDDEAEVPYAENDATMFKEYCIQTLGVSEKHVRYITNAGYNDIRKAMNWLRQGLESYDGEGRAIFYYAGHGIPDEGQKSAYLLPTDGIGSDPGSAYSLEKLYELLGEMQASLVTVFLDACFSGAKRDGTMMTAARGIAIKVKPEEPKGNLVVFTAAQNDETAYPYKSKQHGIFTYFLLRKLQQTKGDVTLGELADYIIKEVKRQSFDENNRKQTPMVKASKNLEEDWKIIKLNRQE